MPQKISTCLWFDSEAEEAAAFYTSVFPNSKVVSTQRYPEGGEGVTGKPAGSVMTVSFEIEGREFLALNGGDDFKFNESVSFIIDCKDQEEADHYWNTLTTNGGQESMCGWLKDKYGVSWQIAPRRLNELLADPDKERAKRVMHAMLQMRRIDIAALEEAANGASKNQSAG